MYVSGKYYINGKNYFKNSSHGFFIGEGGKYNLYGIHRGFCCRSVPWMLIVVFKYYYKIFLDMLYFPIFLNDKSKIINQGEEKVQIKLFKNQHNIV